MREPSAALAVAQPEPLNVNVIELVVDIAADPVAVDDRGADADEVTVGQIVAFALRVVSVVTVAMPDALISPVTLADADSAADCEIVATGVTDNVCGPVVDAETLADTVRDVLGEDEAAPTLGVTENDEALEADKCAEPDSDTLLLADALTLLQSDAYAEDVLDGVSPVLALTAFGVGVLRAAVGVPPDVWVAEPLLLAGADGEAVEEAMGLTEFLALPEYALVGDEPGGRVTDAVTLGVDDIDVTADPVDSSPEELAELDNDIRLDAAALELGTEEIDAPLDGDMRAVAVPHCETLEVATGEELAEGVADFDTSPDGDSIAVGAIVGDALDVPSPVALSVRSKETAAVADAETVAVAAAETVRASSNDALAVSLLTSDLLLPTVRDALASAVAVADSSALRVRVPCGDVVAVESITVSVAEADLLAVEVGVLLSDLMDVAETDELFD